MKYMHLITPAFIHFELDVTSIPNIQLEILQWRIFSWFDFFLNSTELAPDREMQIFAQPQKIWILANF